MVVPLGEIKQGTATGGSNPSTFEVLHERVHVRSRHLVQCVEITVEFLSGLFVESSSSFSDKVLCGEV